MSGSLYLVALPIGNLQDITLRALDTLRNVDAIVAEDTRNTQRLLTHHQIETPFFTSLYQGAEERRVGSRRCRRRGALGERGRGQKERLRLTRQSRCMRWALN